MPPDFSGSGLSSGGAPYPSRFKATIQCSPRGSCPLVPEIATGPCGSFQEEDLNLKSPLLLAPDREAARPDTAELTSEAPYRDL